MAATREMYMSRGPVCTTWPKTTWPISAAGTPDRRSASAVTFAASSVAGTPLRLPPNVPIAVRAPDTT